MTYQSGDLILNKYRVDTLIGEGVCGEVYRVYNVADKTQRAIKVFSQSTIGTGNLGFFNCRQRFRFEFQLAARLNSPEINPYLLQIYDFTDTSECMVLEMEYAPGGSLRSKMLSYTQKGLTYPREKALRISYDVAIGLGTLHRSGIVHHNLKASNILFNLRDRIVFSDLGMAQGIAQFDSSSLLNYTNPTPDLSGNINLDRRLAADFASPSTDIYSLGLILFEMITGKDYTKFPPHTHLRDFIPGVKQSLDDLLASMMHEADGLKDLDALTVAHELQQELEAEEQARREVLSRKYDELAEWERLKNSELSRQKGDSANQSTRPVSEIKEKAKPEAARDDMRTAEVIAPDVQEFKKIVENGDAKKSTATEKSELPEESLSTVKETPSSEKPGIKVPKKVIIILALAILILGIAGVIYWNFFLRKPEKKPVSAQVPVITQVTSAPKATDSAILPGGVTSIPAAQPPEDAPTVELPDPSVQPAGATQPVPPTETNPSTVLYSTTNPGFEDTSGWALKIGDSHILGKFTSDWASEGANSYKIYMIGDVNYEYCFISGIRTTINQTVDLTDVDEILFDLNLKPGATSVDSQGNPVRTKAVAFIDKEQLYLSGDNATGQQLNQRLILNKRYSGKHDLKFGLMTTYHFCVKGKNEADSLSIFIDNIRLVTH